VSEGGNVNGRKRESKGGSEGSGRREGRGPMKSVDSRARKVASPPLGKRATATGNARG